MWAKLFIEVCFDEEGSANENLMILFINSV